MAKRTNPFIDDFVPQSKVHVGLKQFNNNDDRLKKVYEKTLELLFKGSKKYPAQDVIKSDNTYGTKDKMKQLFIGKNGALLHSGSMVKEDNLTTKQCSCGAALESQCAYCEIVLCSKCQHCCVKCERSYCTRCTLIGSEGSEVCVSCYG